eukprot:COSAG06_NODE_2755_length_6337_cov_7.492145_2_plen_72_part_00
MMATTRCRAGLAPANTAGPVAQAARAELGARGSYRLEDKAAGLTAHSPTSQPMRKVSYDELYECWYLTFIK